MKDKPQLMKVKYYLMYMSCLNEWDYCCLEHVRNLDTTIMEFDSFEQADEAIDNITDKNLDGSFNYIIRFDRDSCNYIVDRDYIFIMAKK